MTRGAVPASLWAPRYARSVLVYCWRCWRGRVVAWLATAAAIAAVLSLATCAELFLVLSERSLSQQVRSASEFQVFIADGATQDQVNDLKARISGLPGVRGVTYRDKTEALRRAHDNSALATIAENVTANPFPASLVVQLSDPGAANRVSAVASQHPATDRDVPSSYTPAQGRRMSAILSLAQAVVVGVGVASLAVASLVALVLLRGEIRARRAELRILTLVGTPRPVIRLPVFVEAISLAVAGSLLATLGLIYAGGSVVPAVNGYLPFLQLGSAASVVGTISLVTLASSAVALGGASLLVRLPR